MSRSYNLARIRKNHSYTRAELTELLGVNVGTISRWCKEGLRPIDRHRPYLFFGAHVVAFLRGRANPHFALAPGELLCVSCRVGRPTQDGLVWLEPRSPTTVNFVGFCEESGHKMFRRVRIAQIAERLGPAKVASEDAIATMSNSRGPDRVQSLGAEPA